MADPKGDDKRRLSNDGRLTKATATDHRVVVSMPGTNLRHEATIHHDVPQFAFFTRVPYEPLGVLLIEPLTPEGLETLRNRARTAIETYLAANETAMDAVLPWRRVIWLHYSTAAAVVPGRLGPTDSAEGRFGSRVLHDWDLPGFHAKRSAEVHTRGINAEGRAAWVFDWTTGGSDSIGPLLAGRIEMADGAGRNGDAYHAREWEEDFTIRMERWRAKASSSLDHQETKPKRARGTLSSFDFKTCKFFPWDPDLWDAIQDLQERIRAQDRAIRQFIQETPAEALGAHLIAGSGLLALPHPEGTP